MFFRTRYREVVLIMWVLYLLIGCVSLPAGAETPASQSVIDSVPISPTLPLAPNYEFPISIDPADRYLFYLHGKIIEDQGIPAISPDYGEYQYEAILEVLSGYGFVVISEQRPRNTDGMQYAIRIAEQVAILLEAGIPAEHITVVGASKGAGIAVFVSHLLENDEVNFVIMAICHPDVVEGLKQDQITLKGNILSIYDSVDEYAGSCEELFSLSAGQGLSRHDEVVLNIGTGHGILYKPMDEWILPVVEWGAIDH